MNHIQSRMNDLEVDDFRTYLKQSDFWQYRGVIRVGHEDYDGWRPAGARGCLPLHIPHDPEDDGSLGAAYKMSLLIKIAMYERKSCLDVLRGLAGEPIDPDWLTPHTVEQMVVELSHAQNLTRTNIRNISEYAGLLRGKIDDLSERVTFDVRLAFAASIIAVVFSLLSLTM